MHGARETLFLLELGLLRMCGTWSCCLTVVQEGTFQNCLTLGMDKVEVRKTGNGEQKGTGICHLLELGSEADRNKVSELECPYPLPNRTEEGFRYTALGCQRAWDSFEVCVSHSSLAFGHLKWKAFQWLWWQAETSHFVPIFS